VCLASVCSTFCCRTIDLHERNRLPHDCSAFYCRIAQRRQHVSLQKPQPSYDTCRDASPACVWGLGVIFSLASLQCSISFGHAMGSSIGLLAIRSPDPQRHSIRFGITGETAGCCMACMCVQCACPVCSCALTGFVSGGSALHFIGVKVVRKVVAVCFNV